MDVLLAEIGSSGRLTEWRAFFQLRERLMEEQQEREHQEQMAVKALDAINRGQFQ